MIYRTVLRGRDRGNGRIEAREMTIELTTTLETIDCISCGMVFAVPSQWIQTRRRNHKDFWCPGCKHRMHYPGKSDLEELRGQLATAKDLSATYRRRRDYNERCRAAELGAKTKLKKRMAAGVCASGRGRDVSY